VPEASINAQYLVPLVRVILLELEKVNVSNVRSELRLLQLKASDTAKADPVGFPVEPYVPV
jgi:hypothetical protein